MVRGISVSRMMMLMFVMVMSVMFLVTATLDGKWSALK